MSESKSKTTFIEWMVLVSIIAIAVGTAVPGLQEARRRSLTSECRSNLALIHTHQRGFKAVRGRFAHVHNTEGSVVGAPPMPWSNQPCDKACNTHSHSCNQFSCIGFRPAGHVRYQYRAPANKEGTAFAAGCRADLDEDGRYGGFAFQSSAAPDPDAKGTVKDGISGCPADQPSNLVINCRPGSY